MVFQFLVPGGTGTLPRCAHDSQGLAPPWSQACVARPQGIQASIALANFQCWSYQASLFEAVDGGLHRRCGGAQGPNAPREHRRRNGWLKPWSAE